MWISFIAERGPKKCVFMKIFWSQHLHVFELVSRHFWKWFGCRHISLTYFCTMTILRIAIILTTIMWKMMSSMFVSTKMCSLLPSKMLYCIPPDRIPCLQTCLVTHATNKETQQSNKLCSSVRYALNFFLQDNLGIFPKRRTSPPPPFWEPLVQFLLLLLLF